MSPHEGEHTGAPLRFVCIVLTATLYQAPRYGAPDAPHLSANPIRLFFISRGVLRAMSVGIRLEAKMKRSRGSDASAVRGDSSENPRLPGTTKPFSLLPQGKAPDLRPERSVAILSAPAAERAVAFSGYSSRLTHLLDGGSMEAVGSGPKQVAVKSSPEGDPALVWVRPAGRLPVTVFTGAQTELGSKYILITLAEKTRGQGDFFIKKIGW